MKKLLICCIYGTTAASLAKRMQTLADQRGYPLQISATGMENLASLVPAFDDFLIAPHIQYKTDEVKSLLTAGQSLSIIDGPAYVSMDAERILASVMRYMSEPIDQTHAANS